MHSSTVHSASRRLAALLGLCVAAAFSVAHAAPADASRAPGAQAGTPGLDTQVKAVCPQIEAQLAETLGKSQARYRDVGTAVVSFRLNGTVIEDVRQYGGPVVYRSDLRRAVRHLSCDNGSNSKTYVMKVAFTDGSASASTLAQSDETATDRLKISEVAAAIAERRVGPND